MNKWIRVAILLAASCLVPVGAPAYAQTEQELAQAAYAGGDYAEAAKRYRTLAEKGDPVAQTKMGIFYQLGQGVDQDYVQARIWYAAAAAQGHADAQRRLDLLATKLNLHAAEKKSVSDAVTAAENDPDRTSRLGANLLNLSAAATTGYVQGKESSDRLAQGYKSKLEAAKTAESLTTAAGCDRAAMETACADRIAQCKGGTQYACFQAASCACRVQKNAGGCGNPPGYLDQCIAKADADAARIHDPNAKVWAPAGPAPKPSAHPLANETAGETRPIANAQPAPRDPNARTRAGSAR